MDSTCDASRRGAVEGGCRATSSARAATSARVHARGPGRLGRRGSPHPTRSCSLALLAAPAGSEAPAEVEAVEGPKGLSCSSPCARWPRSQPRSALDTCTCHRSPCVFLCPAAAVELGGCALCCGPQRPSWPSRGQRPSVCSERPCLQPLQAPEAGAPRALVAAVAWRQPSHHCSCLAAPQLPSPALSQLTLQTLKRRQTRTHSWQLPQRPCPGGRLLCWRRQRRC